MRIVPQAHAYVVERLGAYQGTWSVGLHVKVPFIDRVARKVNLKEQVVDFPPQPVITKDNVTMQIDTVVYFQITDPKLYSYGVENPIMAIENLTATTLRNVIGDLELDETLTSRETINTQMRATLDVATDPWGIKVNRVELKNIIPPTEIQNAMEKQMKAERERREAILKAEGEKKSTILVAEGKKESAILDAEAEKEKKAEPKETPDSSTEEATPSVVQQEETALQTNENGWDGLLQSFGLNGFSDIGKNLGYVLAMLPDVLVGLFTGKTKSLNMDNSLLPLASIVAGMFVKNPILKMLLMGMGGANLLNKAGHEVLGRKQQEGIAPTVSPAASRIQYRQYPDEPLNPRISNPMLQGRCLVANIDHVPCTIQLPDSVIGAHQSGALPLNTLANAILAKNDQMRQMAAMQYEEQARESVVRPRGIQ